MKNPQRFLPDQPLFDATPYGYGQDDSISISYATENAAITQHKLALKKTMIAYTARAGHLVTTDPHSPQPAAKIFYVSFTANGASPSKRPVTFLYNGGPGSSSVYLLLGSFGPRRIKTSGIHYTPPAPYALKDNQESLLDQTDLVFIDPVGTAYSTAIAPHKNSDFWGVDADAGSIAQFVKRYLTAFNRWNSPKFLYGESYGTPRTCALTWLLHEEGVDLNGIILQSSLLDYSRIGDPIGLLPTLAADAWYHKKAKPRPANLSKFTDDVAEFALTEYASAKATFPKVNHPKVLQKLSGFLGIPPNVLKSWKLDPTTHECKLFLTTLLKDESLSIYDGRVTAPDTGIAASIPGNDPAMMAVGSVYTAMWHAYLNNELKFTSVSPFLAQNTRMGFPIWNFGHTDPTGTKIIDNLDTIGDLAAAMELNPYLKVFSANGYYDAMSPFFQTKRNFELLPLGSDDAREKALRYNLTYRNYPAGHMIYLDDKSRIQMKRDLAIFYKGAAPRKPEASIPIRPSKVRIRRISRAAY
jgi:carboxypeptidase C (cathepsin A)